MLRTSKLGLLRVKAEELNKKGQEEMEAPVTKTLPSKKEEPKKPLEFKKLAEERVLRITDGTSLVFSVSKTEEGEPHVDIRTHVHTDKYDGPTKRGVNFNIEFLEDFRQILDMIDSELTEKGL